MVGMEKWKLPEPESGDFGHLRLPLPPHRDVPQQKTMTGACGLGRSLPHPKMRPKHNRAHKDQKTQAGSRPGPPLTPAELPQGARLETRGGFASTFGAVLSWANQGPRQQLSL